MVSDKQVAIAIGDKDCSTVWAMIKKMSKGPDAVRAQDYGDDIYYVFYWAMGSWRSGDEAARNLLSYVKNNIRHSLIEIDEDGKMDTDILIDTDDGEGEDETFYEILDWSCQITVAGSTLPVLCERAPYTCAVKADRVADILRAYVNNDAEGTDPDYIREILQDICGCSDEELKALGLEEYTRCESI